MKIKGPAAESFSERMVTMLNGSALTLAIAIGYKLQLFDILDEMSAPCSAEELAKEAGVSERYVREWLGVMVCGDVVHCTQAEGQPITTQNDFYALPKEHGDLLARRAGSANMGVYAQEVPLLTRIAHDNVLEGFRTGKGVAPAVYPEFREFMQELAVAKCHSDLLQNFLPSIQDGKLLSRLKKGIDVCDLGCGSGEALALMAEAFPNSRFTGVDVDASALAAATKRLQQAQCKKVQLLQADAAALLDDPNMRERFDYVLAFDAIHDQQRPSRALKAVQTMLKPNGLFSMVDIAAESNIAANADHPLGAFLYTVSLMHCLPVGLYDNGEGLGMMWGRDKAFAMLREAGFSKIERLDMPFDPFNDHYLSVK